MLERIERKGEQGSAYWRTKMFGDIRVRMVEYTPGYRADHWCSKGHILLCLEGELHTELQDGRTFTLTAGMSYQAADNERAECRCERHLVGGHAGRSQPDYEWTQQSLELRLQRINGDHEYFPRPRKANPVRLGAFGAPA